ncbi:MAG: hypothetical protein IJK99_00190 [Bacteroidales bacterium]|nr:hypothetical protein [Bacteroidales bacterium]
MKSMTGFAKWQYNLNETKYTIEIKTLNSKQLDANVKLPADLREHELEIRSMLNSLERGKVDFVISEEHSASTASHIDNELARQRYNELLTLANDLGSAADEKMLLGIVLQQPDIWTAADDATLSDE